jgi:hypothetical protein
MKLAVHERLALLTLLPKKGDYAALGTIRRTREMLSFTPEELAFYEIRTGQGPDGKPQTQWSTKKANEVVRDVPVDEYMTRVFRNALSEMNNKGELTEEYLSVFDKFVIIYQ